MTARSKASETTYDSVSFRDVKDNQLPNLKDTRHIRDQVDDHPYVVVVVALRWTRESDIYGEEDAFLDRNDIWYFHFDEVEDANAFYSEAKARVDKDLATNGFYNYIVARLETGSPLQVRQVTAHGSLAREMDKEFRKTPERLFFMHPKHDDAAPKAKAPRRQVKKGVVAPSNTPKVRAKPKREITVPTVEPQSDWPKPVARGLRKRALAARKS